MSVGCEESGVLTRDEGTEALSPTLRLPSTRQLRLFPPVACLAVIIFNSTTIDGVLYRNAYAYTYTYASAPRRTGTDRSKQTPPVVRRFNDPPGINDNEPKNLGVARRRQ